MQPSEYTDSYGRKRSGYFTEDGRPLDWWAKDGDRAIETACFCCSVCGTELELKQRTDEAEYRCTLHGVRLDDYLKTLPQDYNSTDRLAIHLSPLTRVNSQHLARDLIDKGLKGDDPRVWQQEDLGIPSQGLTARLTMESLTPLIGASYPGTKPWRTYAGLDFGRNGVWLWIIAVHLPLGGERLEPTELRKKAIREVKFGARIHKDQVATVCNRFGVDFGLVDNEPEISWSADLCAQTGYFHMVNQSVCADDFKRGTTQTGGEQYPCWQINNKKWHWDVLWQVIAPHSYDDRPSFRFPSAWRKWVDLPSEDSPLRHLTGPSFDNSREKWVRGNDKIDDLFYAALFAEVAFAIDVEQGEVSGVAIAEIDW
jgi:hypothetical protein